MKSIQLNVVAMTAVLAVVGAAGAVGGAFIGYGQGYKQGDKDGRHDASRSAISSVSELMTRGIAIAQPDGTAKTYVLQPAEAAKH